MLPSFRKCAVAIADDLDEDPHVASPAFPSLFAVAMPGVLSAERLVQQIPFSEVKYSFDATTWMKLGVRVC